MSDSFPHVDHTVWKSRTRHGLVQVDLMSRSHVGSVVKSLRNQIAREEKHLASLDSQDHVSQDLASVRLSYLHGWLNVMESRYREMRPPSLLGAVVQLFRR